MGFWGVEVVPGKPYPYQSDDVHGKLHVTQATLGNGSSTKKSVVQCLVGEKSPVFLCSLLPEKLETCSLNLEFDANDVVTFSVIGSRSVHLTGFIAVDGRDLIGYDSDSDSFGEDIAETDTEERSTDYDSEDDYDEDFIDDGDFQMFPPSRVPNRGVVLEEILDDEKPANAHTKQLKRKNKSSKSDDNDRQIVVKSNSGVPVLESEDEDGFPVSAAQKREPDAKKSKVEVEEKIEQKTKKETKKRRRKDDGGISETKIDSIIQDGQEERGVNQPLDSSLPSNEILANDLKKKNKKQKEQGKEGKSHETHDEDKSNELPVVMTEENQKLANEKTLDTDSDHVSNGNRSVEKKKKKKKKKSKTQESSGDASKGETVTSNTNGSAVALEEKKDKLKSSQVRTFPNGLVIEEVAMGKPDGKRASPGNKVSVHYIGKLKKNGSIFDSNVGRAPFKFRLGVGQVIKGWDVGVNGMRVGDKRRLTIPPSMGYGAQHAGKIPPNSWLMFDVELIDVR